MEWYNSVFSWDTSTTISSLKMFLSTPEPIEPSAMSLFENFIMEIKLDLILTHSSHISTLPQFDYLAGFDLSF